MNHTNNYILKQNKYILKNKYFSGKKIVGIILHINYY